ncbi:MAG: hypothetical protein KUG78_02645 [Kangiellaceae bacterium]|nr:hypothetical protein [Kangiellaceae bacterium]
MKTSLWLNPLLSMIATLSMCIILSVSHDISASPHHEISISHNGNERIYHVNGKSFTYDQLGAEDKAKLSELEGKLKDLELALEFDESKMEKWERKMERVARKIERKVAMFESSFDRDSFEEVSEKLAESGRHLEIEMDKLEQHLRSIEANIPKIDSALINNLKGEARQLEALLIEIADSL